MKRARGGDITRQIKPASHRSATAQGSTMKLTLSLATAVPRIEGASPAWLAEFGLDAAACRGRTINIVTGPESNVKQLASLLEHVQHGKQAAANVTLYDRAGAGALFRVHVQPSCSAKTCEVAMQRCDTVAYDAAVEEDGTAKVLLEARKPFKVHRASSAFETAYGFEAGRLANRTLSIITGPNTDAKALQQMLDGALEGSTRNACLQTYTRYGTEVGAEMSRAQATPVVQDGDIKYLLVIMGPAATGSHYHRSSSSEGGSNVEFPNPEDFDEPLALPCPCIMAALPARPVRETGMPARRRRDVAAPCRLNDADAAPSKHNEADAPVSRHQHEHASLCRLLVTVFVCCSAFVVPWDAKYLALLLGALMLWCALDVLAAHSPQQTRVRARGAASRGRNARSQYAREWALLHENWTLSDDEFSPY